MWLLIKSIYNLIWHGAMLVGLVLTGALALSEKSVYYLVFCGIIIVVISTERLENKLDDIKKGLR